MDDMLTMVPQELLIECLKAESRAEDIRALVKRSLEAGAEVEQGIVTAKLISSTRRSPKWKEIVSEMFGKDVVEKIISDTPETQITSLKIDVKKQALA